LPDFTGVVDKYHHHARRKRELEGTVQYEHAVRVKNTMDWIEADQQLLATNFLISTVEILNISLSTVCATYWNISHGSTRWCAKTPESIRAAFVERISTASAGRLRGRPATKTLERQALEHFVADKLLGGLDFDPALYRIMSFARTAAFMKVYFAKIDPSFIMWFTPTREVDNDDDDDYGKS
jgi:hypothetical protein